MFDAIDGNRFSALWSIYRFVRMSVSLSSHLDDCRISLQRDDKSEIFYSASASSTKFVQFQALFCIVQTLEISSFHLCLPAGTFLFCLVSCISVAHCLGTGSYQDNMMWRSCVSLPLNRPLSWCHPVNFPWDKPNSETPFSLGIALYQNPIRSSSSESFTL